MAVKKDVIPIACGQKICYLSEVQAPALFPTSCVTLTKLLKYLNLHFSDLPSMRNNLCSPRSLETQVASGRWIGCEPHCTMCIEEVILITALNTRLFSAPIPTVIFKGRGKTHPASQGVSTWWQAIISYYVIQGSKSCKLQIQRTPISHTWERSMEQSVGPILLAVCLPLPAIVTPFPSLSHYSG